ncbi:transglutaminase domain-containing protein [Acaryochloris marina]|uniref:Transglutaminase-like superfamily protein, putative n=1 Tax=Acaryochloris marina (strain MBIC 11017) TaxID=329726 RepID=B0CAN8_ACAM1|nr:transglutaminase domain-containing protein [Acaryochloris marina]ABW30239.1 transglutaminase-like superfamily protein, putative [Acaryochloris marina MBIC11017]
MKQSTPTLCSLSLCFWGYQTGAWIIAIPLALALEAREMIKQRWSLSLEQLKQLHIAALFVWLLAVFFLPPVSPEVIPYAARYHLIKCLPVGLFPFVLAQTYCRNFVSVYRQYLGDLARSWKTVNWYYPYFGICLLAASATGGNLFVFLAISALLIALFLGTVRWPVNRKLALRFSQSTLYGLIVLALVLSLVGTHQFYWLQANVRLPGPAVFGEFFQKMARIWPDDPGRGYPEDLERLLEDMELEANTDTVVSSRTPNGNQNSNTPGSSSTSNGNLSATTSGTPSNSGNDSRNPSTSDGATEENTGEANEDSSSTSEQEPDSDVSQSNEDTSPSDSSDSSPEQNTGPSLPSTIPTPPSNRGQGNRTPGRTQASQPGRDGGQSLPSLVQRSGGIVDPEKAQTQIGNIGSLQRSNAILFRVAPNANRPKPQFPLYIREATYNQYQSGSWNAVNSKFSVRRPQSRQSWRLGEKTEQTTSVRISSDLPRKDGILKLPLGSSEVNQLQVRTLEENQYGTVAIQGKPGPLTYTVQYDPKQSADSPPTAFDKAVPATEKRMLKKITNSLDLNGKSDAEKVEAISTFFKKQGFKYSLDLPTPKKNKTPIAAFLLDHRTGHCEYYASATSLLLRAAGVPTRYAVGYTAHEYSPTEQQYIVRLKDAHAWVLAYVDNTWVKVETTPGGGMTAEGNTSTAQSENAQGDNTQTQDGSSQQDGVPTQDGSRDGNSGTFSEDGNANQDGISSEDGSFTGEKNQPPSKSFFEKLSEAWSELMTLLSENSETLAWASSMIILGLVIVFGSIYLIWRMIRKKLSKRSQRRRRPSSERISKPTSDGLDSEFYQIEKRLSDWGLARLPSETVRKWLGRLEQELPDAYMSELHQIIDLHYRYRFDPQGLTEEEREKLKLMIQSWLSEFKQLTVQGSHSAIKQ